MNKYNRDLRNSRLKKFDTHRGYYGIIGDRTVIKNCKIIKDVNIGSDAYLKGANKLKNLTINSSAEANSQIGEGCELVNGIIDYGCRIFYGVKAVRFFMASHSQLKYGARLINSYLGDNSTISCCEVLNSLIFPFHEQHHNNSFLCAALLQGQTNIAAGATIGSNHNSRSPDGEILAGRGFWPGLCVSLKHNSRFASFTIIAKGDFPAELNIPIPFSLVSNDVSNDMLVVMPGYWFMYNMYALARNSWKYTDRDKRTQKKQLLEHDFLAPDTIHEIITALELFQSATGHAWIKKHPELSGKATDIGRDLLEANDERLDDVPIFADGFEHTHRKTKLLKVRACYQIFKDLISYHAGNLLVDFILRENIGKEMELRAKLPADEKVYQWKNIGGQLIKTEVIESMNMRIKDGSIEGWDDIHKIYSEQARNYPLDKLQHAIAALKKVHHESLQDTCSIKTLLLKSVEVRKWMVNNIYDSREKDYTNPFRLMVYENPAEMDKVVGSLQDNPFITQEKQTLETYRANVERIIQRL